MPTNRRIARDAVLEGASETEEHPETSNPPEQEITLADIEADIRQLREDIATLARQLSRNTERSYDNARQVAADGIDHLRAQGEAAIDTLRTSARDMEAEVIRTVRDKPVTALAIAAAFGYLVALITRR